MKFVDKEGDKFLSNLSMGTLKLVVKLLFGIINARTFNKNSLWEIRVITTSDS